MSLAIITETLDAEAADWLAGYVEVAWCPHEDGGALPERLPQAEALIVRTYTRVDDALLERAPKLKVVARAGVGLDNIDLDACRRRRVRVVYAPDANTQAVVEYVFALILDALRPRVTFDAPVAESQFHRWRKERVGRQLDTLTLGVLGFGRIGRRVGRAAHALGVNVIVNDLLPDAELRKAADYPFDAVDKPQLYARADVLSIHVDGRPSNRHLLDAEALAQLKPTCLLLNTARGMLVDAAALADWARRAHPQGGRAVIDVHDPEPPPSNYPLFGLSNVTLLPHLASRTDKALANMSWVVRDVVAVLEGREPRNAAV